MKRIVFMAVALVMLTFVPSANAQEQVWPQGGPDYLYVKPLRKPQHHGVFDKGMKCLDCHRYGIDNHGHTQQHEAQHHAQHHPPISHLDRPLRLHHMFDITHKTPFH